MLLSSLPLGLILLLSNCATIGTTVTKGVDEAPCSAFKPIYTRQCRDVDTKTGAEIKQLNCDILSDPTAKAILATDRTGQKLCHWEPHHSPAKAQPGNASVLNKP